MSGLGKRLTALESIAEEVRLRPFRKLAEEHRIPFETMMALWENARTETAELRARGMTDREIIAHKAARLGKDPDALWGEGMALADRLNGY